MSPQNSLDILIEALFVSDVQRSQEPSPELIRTAVTATVERHGAGGCAALVAQEFGEHPDSAVGRMRWARSAVSSAYLTHDWHLAAERRAHPVPSADSTGSRGLATSS